MFWTLFFQGALNEANRVPDMQIATQFNFCPHVELTPNFPNLMYQLFIESPFCGKSRDFFETSS